MNRTSGRNAQRKIDKRQARKQKHTDKYEHRIAEQDLDSKLAELARHFNGEEADDE